MQAAAIRMTPHQIALVRESFATVVPISEQAVGLFYDRLFAIDPSTRPLFQGDARLPARKDRNERAKSDGFRAAFYSSWYTSHDSRAAVASRSPSSANSSRSATSRSTASASRADQASRDA